ncbi:DUF3263 domain-containing protein [Saccharopolyspora sp. HNM0983]|uniref:DUF3263 domain-containing protein n=1 Tax=Saccharopolyspora montiporae TaxID=2781240 RepID=A0A929B9T8_9PSEU|nr:DUF3263 domain-containing protein [Saccharopolyspora sp. HNM0983]
MDAAQMLTAQEIARQCERLATRQPQQVPEQCARPGLRSVDPITEPIERIVDPDPAPDPAPQPPDDLTERDRGILAFERQWWKRSGAKEDAIRELFGMSASRYYQLLNALLDSPAALRADPMLIKRLRKARAARRRARAAQRLGIELH